MTDDQTFVWRWPQHIVMSPSSLKAFGQCAYRNKLRYLQNIDPPEKWVRVFALGNATHSALGTIAQQMQAGANLIGDAEVRMLCSLHMPDHEYPTEESREADINSVLRWVEVGKRYLQNLNVQRWLLIERSERRPISLFETKTEYTILSKPDLVVERLDENGEPFIHIIDWKTGSRKLELEEDVPVIMRYVLRQQLQQWTGDASAANVLFTWVWLDENASDPWDASVENCNYRWPGVLEQIEAMATETEWKATPGWYCRYCPYYGNYCKEEIPPESDW